MDISLEHLAQLAKLDLGEMEKDLFAGQLKDILVYMEKLGELDTSDIDPTSHVIYLGNVFREDLPEASLGREEALGNAPDSTEKFYRVPKIIE